MRIPFQRFLASARPNPQLRRSDEDVADPVGASGTLNHLGFISPEEFNDDLRGLQGINTYLRMLRTDPSVRETVWHIMAPILNADWTVEPPENPNELEQEVTAFVRAAYFDWMARPFMEYLTQALMYLPFGHAVFEPQYQVVERSLMVEYSEALAGEETGNQVVHVAEFPGQKPVEPPTPSIPVKKSRTIPSRQFVTWRKFAPRLQKTIQQWIVDREGELVKIRQFAPVPQGDGTSDYQTIDIGAEFLIVYTNEMWGEDYTGVSIMRSAFKPWLMKETIERISAQAYERHGTGVDVVYMPRNREDDEAVADKLEEMLQNIRAGESSYLLFPGPRASGNQDGYEFDIKSPDGGIPDFKSILEYYRGEIAGAMLARFKELGHSATGARATANVQAEVWYNSLHAIARYMGNVNDVAIRRLVDLNYNNVERYPRLVAANIEARNLLEFAQAVALLANAKALALDNPTRAWIRRSIDGPGEDPEEAQIRAENDHQEQSLQQLSMGGLETDPGETARPRVSKSSTST